MSHKDFNLGMECICDKTTAAWPFGIQIPDDQIIACHHAEDCPVYLLSLEFETTLETSKYLAQEIAFWETQYIDHSNTFPVEVPKKNPFEVPINKSFLL